MRIQTACLIAAINAKLAPAQYRLLAEWLDAYEYVVPDDRKLHNDLSITLARHTANAAGTPTEFFSLWIAIDILYHNATMQSQSEILSWIYASSKYHIAAR